MTPETPYFSEPFDLGGRRSFRLLAHRSAVPPMPGASVLVQVMTADDGGEGEKEWVGVEPHLRLAPGETVQATYEDARQFVRFLTPGSDGSGITIEVIPEL